MSKVGMLAGFLFFFLLIGQQVARFDRLGMVFFFLLPLLLMVLLNVEWGVYGLLFLGFSVMFIKRMMPGLDMNQVGLAMDALLLLMALRVSFDLLVERKYAAFSSPLTLPVLVFTLYLFLEIFNPLAPSLMFGITGTRATIRILGFFIFLHAFRSRLAIKRFLFVWLFLAFFEGLYGIWQHHHGLLYQEFNWLIESRSANTHILNGYIRIFGTLGDAATFGFVQIAGALILMAMALTGDFRKRAFCIVLSLPMLYAAVLSYSRGPIVAFAAGVLALIGASRNLKLAIALLLLFSFGTGALTLSGKDHLVDRLASAATPAEDASFQVRMDYLNRFLPEIITHPFGFGLNTTGASGASAAGGEVYYGTTVGIPTDNQYFKYGLELGWVGLLLFLWLYRAFWWRTYRIFETMEDPFFKSVALGLFAVLTAFGVGAFSNDIYGQKPISEFLFLAFGLVALLGQHRRMDGKKEDHPVGFG
ncbi:MAG TPA: hypothetical protein DD435_01485 [Cyanobacteria bacterium UBA8530]|nr:hypothetical protein [Cyanobacteria bacterium UBA8530]